MASAESRKLPVPPSGPKPRKKNLSEAEQLEIENRKLEDRLRELKESLKKQKEAREAKGGYTWKSGRTGGIGSHAQEVLQDNTRRRMEGRKMKILQADSSARVVRQPSAAETSPSAGSQPSLLEGSFNDQDSHASFLEALNEWRSGKTAPDAKSSTSSGAGELLVGEFSEADSHASFLEAVNAWRNAPAAGAAPAVSTAAPAQRMWAPPSAAPESTTSEIQTEPRASSATSTSITFSTTSTLSYMDQLLLKKSRRLASAVSVATTAKSPVTQPSDDEESDDDIEPDPTLSLEERIAWLSKQLEQLNAEENQENNRPNTRQVVEFEEVVDGEDDGSTPAPAVEEPDDAAPVSKAPNTAPANGRTSEEMSIVDLKDEIEEAVSRAATAQQLMTGGSLDLPANVAINSDDDTDDDSDGTPVPAGESPAIFEPVDQGAPAVDPVVEEQRVRELQAKMAAVERELRVSNVSPRRKKSAPLPVPGQDEKLHRMSAEPERSPSAASDLPQTPQPAAPPSAPETVKAGGPRVHEHKPAELTALSMSMMDDFEDVERAMTPS